MSTHNLAKTPLNAAHAPLASARTIHWFRCAQLRLSSAAGDGVSTPRSDGSSESGRVSSSECVESIPATAGGCFFILEEGGGLFLGRFEDIFELEGAFTMDIAVPVASESDETEVVGAFSAPLRGRRVGIV